MEYRPGCATGTEQTYKIKHLLPSVSTPFYRDTSQKDPFVTIKFITLSHKVTYCPKIFGSFSNKCIRTRQGFLFIDLYLCRLNQK